MHIDIVTESDYIPKLASKIWLDVLFAHSLIVPISTFILFNLIRGVIILLRYLFIVTHYAYGLKKSIFLTGVKLVLLTKRGDKCVETDMTNHSTDLALINADMKSQTAA